MVLHQKINFNDVRYQPRTRFNDVVISNIINNELRKLDFIGEFDYDISDWNGNISISIVKLKPYPEYTKLRLEELVLSHV